MRAAWSGLVFALLIGLLGVDRLPGRDASDGQPPAPSPQSPARSVLVLRSGEVLAGQVTPAGDRYYVSGPGRQVTVQAADVLLVARDLADTFQQQRAALRPTDIDGHQHLARWCLRHDLVNEAAIEIEHLAARDPRGEATVQLQQRLAARRERPLGDGGQGSGVGGQGSAVRSEATRVRGQGSGNRGQGSGAGDIQDSSVDVPSSVIETFTSKVQPLLLNRCGLSGCHGPQCTAKWQLQRLDIGAVLARRTTLRNLRETLSIVDREHPQRSPLLTAPRAPHGGAKTALFSGRTQVQYETLAAWVASVKTADAAPDGQGKRQPPAGSRSTTKPAPSSPAETVDPFDPAPFNRRFAAPAPPVGAAP